MAIIPKNKARLYPKIGKISMFLFAVMFIVAAIRAYTLFGYIFKGNVSQSKVLLIPTGSTLKDVENIMLAQNVFIEPKAFRWVAKKKDYKNLIKPGRYEILKGWNTNQVVNLLRSGSQSPIKVTFNNVRFFEDLAGKVSKYFELDSVAFLTAFKNDSIVSGYGFNASTFPAMFIPNTYEFYWTTSPTAFIDKMNKEYLKFWNDERKKQAEEQGLTPLEVSTLASIVQEETIKEDEKPTIAGLYLNRLKRGMLLQADPTIKYALHDFSIRRVTNDMLEVESPYNTYKFTGLPPGPINFPELSAINAVLSPKDHKYLYMCAKEDFSGYHNFSTNLIQHNLNAAKYRRALNRNNIYR